MICKAAQCPGSNTLTLPAHETFFRGPLGGLIISEKNPVPKAIGLSHLYKVGRQLPLSPGGATPVWGTAHR